MLRFPMPVTYSRDAEKSLRVMAANTHRLIAVKLEQYADNPASLASNVKALQGKPGYFRPRVGDWRVLFRSDGTVIAVTRIAPIGGAYE
jgi:mRNA interferase RelE/StbE